MAAVKVRNKTATDLNGESASFPLTGNETKTLASLDLKNDGASRGVLFYHLEENNVELLDESDQVISTTTQSSWDREVDGEVVETINETYRDDIKELNLYINLL